MGHRGQGISALALVALLTGCSQQAQMQDADQWSAQAQGLQAAAGFPPQTETAEQASAEQPLSGAPNGAPPDTGDTGRMQPVQIMDANGFGQPMVANEVQVPVDWQTAGGVSWNDGTDCIANQMNTSWRAMAPDSLTVMEIMPGFNWQVTGTENQMNPCPSAPYRSTREFLEATVRNVRPGARVLDYQCLPEAEQAMAQAAQANPQAQVRHDAGRLLIGYQQDGVEMREVLAAAITFSAAQGNVVAGTASINSLRAPNGRLDFDLGKRIVGSLRTNPQWMQAMRQRSNANLQRHSDGQRNSINDWHNRQMAIINARGAADRAAIRMRANQDVATINNATAASNSRSSDVIQRQTIDGINQRNSYAGIDGSIVQSSIHGGDRVFQDNANPDVAYSTSDPYHAPVNATELEQLP